MPNSHIIIIIFVMMIVVTIMIMITIICDMHTNIWLENLKERDHSENLGADGKITSECILRK
jgi:hypothetical protein